MRRSAGRDLTIVMPPTPSTIGHKRRRSTSSQSSTTVDADTPESGSTAFQILDRLIQLAPEDNEVPLPMVAVIGGQSVGKSSLLSMLCDLPLWCAERTSTFGPTHIHSRQRPGEEFSATVYIQLAEPVPGATKRFAFTKTPLKTKDELATVLQMAGNEARRVGDGNGVMMRTYDELRVLREGGLAARIEDSSGWPALTSNAVQLMVTGPKQPDISIVDLPGLVSGDGAMIARRLAEKYLCKSATLILLCIPAGGADPTTDSPETSLVLKHDKDMKRTMIVVTKPDHIGDPTRSAWGDLIANRNKGFRCKPALGVHPVRARTCSEYEDGMSTEEIIATGDDLFSRTKWLQMAEVCQRQFGWRATSTAIYSKYGKLVNDNIPKLQQRVRENIKALQAEESKLPPRIERPVEELHRRIEEIVRAIKAKVVMAKPFIHRLERFRGELAATLPVFVAVCKADEGGLEASAPQSLFGSWYKRTSDAADAPKIYLDDLQNKLLEHPSGDDRFLPHPARASLVRTHIAPWRALCDVLNDEYWKILAEMVDEAVHDACKEAPEIAQLVIHALAALREPLHHRTHAFIAERIEAEQAEIESYSSDTVRDITAVLKRHVGEFTRVYAPAWKDADEFALYDRAVPEPHEMPGQWPKEYVKMLLRFAVTADRHLQESGRRIVADMERVLPNALREGFLPHVAGQLREAFDLLNVRDVVTRRAARLCESNDDIVEQREALAKRRKILEDLRMVLETQK